MAECTQVIKNFILVLKDVDTLSNIKCRGGHIPTDEQLETLANSLATNAGNLAKIINPPAKFTDPVSELVTDIETNKVIGRKKLKEVRDMLFDEMAKAVIKMCGTAKTESAVKAAAKESKSKIDRLME